MTVFDHVLAVGLVVGLPAYAAWEFPRMVRKLEAGVAGARTAEYAWTLAMQWMLTASLLVHWLLLERPLVAMGLTWPPTIVKSTATVLLSIAVVAFFARQARAVARSAKARAQVLEQIEAQPAVRALIPSTRAEARLFVAVGLTAGICEEVLYRGYLFWYFGGLLDRSVAVPMAIAAFGMAHAYQGTRGVVLTGTMGAISMALYLLTGSLVASIVLHATIDVANGHMARLALSTAPPPSSSSQ